MCTMSSAFGSRGTARTECLVGLRYLGCGLCRRSQQLCRGINSERQHLVNLRGGLNGLPQCLARTHPRRTSPRTSSPPPEPTLPIIMLCQPPPTHGRCQILKGHLRTWSLLQQGDEIPLSPRHVRYFFGLTRSEVLRSMPSRSDVSQGNINSHSLRRRFLRDRRRSGLHRMSRAKSCRGCGREVSAFQKLLHVIRSAS